MSPNIPAQHRLEIVDALRGLALAMILVVNMAYFSGFIFRLMLPDFVPTPSESQGNMGMIFFFEGKGYTLFSLLFGLSISMQMERAAHRDFNFWGFHAKRMIILAVIGLCHTLFLWYGDILFVYAVLGLLLPLIRPLTYKALLTFAGILLFLSVPLQLVLIQIVSPPTGGNNFDLAGMIDQLGKGHYWEAFEVNLYICLMKFKTYLFTGRLFKIFGLFMLGYAIGRSHFFQKTKRFLPKLRRALPLLLIFGLLGNLLFLNYHNQVSTFYPTNLNILYESLYGLGIVPLAFSFAIIFILLWHHKRRWRSVLSIFAPYGRMALTNYLMQSVICVLIFHGWGFGLMPKMTFMAALLMIPFIVGVQILFSRLWLWYFRYGPCEWLWRILSYGQMFQLRR